MIKQKYTYIALTICSAALLSSTTVQAGFEFTAPVTQQNANTQIQAGDNSLLPTMDDEGMLPPVVQEPTPVSQPNISWSNEPTQPTSSETPSMTTPQQSIPRAPMPSSRETAPTGIMSIAPKQQMAEPEMASTPQTSENTFRVQTRPNQTSEPIPTFESNPFAEPNPTPVAQDTKTPTESISTEKQYDMAVGFGKDLPLVSALRQVVPPEYTYVLTNSIDSSQKVSWNGGQQWPNVLSDMLAPTGLSANISGNIVTIQEGMRAPDTAMTTPEETTEPEPSFATVNEPVEISAPTGNNNMFVRSYTPLSKSVKADPAPVAQPTPMRSDRRPPVLTRTDDSAASVQPFNANPVSLQPSQPVQIQPEQPAQSPFLPQALATQPFPPQAVRSRPEASNMAVSTTETPDTSKTSVVPEVSEGQWMAQSGTSLKTVLESWSNLEGVDLFWSSDYDYILAGDVNINGTYESAVKNLLEGFSEAQPKPIGRLHPNLPNGPAVLVIETRKVIS